MSKQKVKHGKSYLYWVSLVVFTIAAGLAIPLLYDLSWERALLFLGIALVAEGVAYYGRMKGSVTLNRVMYTLIGVPVGFILWIILFNVLSSVNLWYGENLVFVIATLAISFGIGAVIGDSIGRACHYKGPESYRL